jgi:hypothetical protein
VSVRESWSERLHDDRPHVVKRPPISIAGVRAGQLMLVPSARLVDAFVRRIARGRSLTPQQLRARMAQAHAAEMCCPITTGFHLRTVAEAVGEALAAGTPITRVTPVRRVLPPGAPTLVKLSFDASVQLRQRQLDRPGWGA